MADESQSDTDSPPRKIGYRYCSHCNQTVSTRTYRKHCSLAGDHDHELFSSETGLMDETLDQLSVEHETLVEADQTLVEPPDQILVEPPDQTLVEPDQSLDDEMGSDSDHGGQSSDSDSEEYSSSEYEETDLEQDGCTNVVVQSNEPTSVITLWFIVFVRLWQMMFSISDAAIGVLLKFMNAFLKLLASLTSSDILATLVAHFPKTFYLLQKYLKSDNQPFVSYAVCPSCYSLYKHEDCFTQDDTGDRVPKRCAFVKFPKHPQRSRRLPCNAPLLNKIKSSGGVIKYVPRYTYAYQPLKQSLQKLLNRPGLAEQLEHWRTRKPREGYMSDIFDGKIWEEFKTFLASKRHYGLMLNFDFFQPYKHTTDSYGVIYISLINLPRDIRFKQENILLVGIVPSFEHEPSSLNSFMQPLVEELKEFWDPGVRLFTAESPKFKLLFKAALMCVACDIPAARKLCGFMGHSASYGCSRCLKYFPGGSDFSGFERENWPLRNLSDHVKACKKLLKCKSKSEKAGMESETGIKYSILIELPYFNPIQYTIIDPMHNLFLGTAKHLMKLWLERDLITKDQLKVLQTRVDSIRVPSGVGRIPRKISSSFGGFTAEQWKNWVILYSMFALRGLLPEPHYICWQTFVLACYFLCRREISHVDLTKADLLLLKFCKTVEELYGPEVITPNMHLHCHIVECVKDYGSIYNFWLFSFERYNGILGNFPTNKRNTSVQMMERFVYEAESFQIPLPDLFNEHFLHVLPYRQVSEVHCHSQPSLNNVYSHFELPSVYKFAIMSPDDCEKLKLVYSHIYEETTDAESILHTIKVFKTITLYKQHLGSLKTPSTAHSSHIMASWAKSDGSIAASNSGSLTTPRPGKVLYYFVHEYKSVHLFAAVYWFKSHHCHSLYGKPLEIWSEDHIDEGPAMFLPIDKVLCRCAVTYASIPLPDNKIERVLFVSPLPSLRF